MLANYQIYHWFCCIYRNFGYRYVEGFSTDCKTNDVRIISTAKYLKGRACKMNMQIQISEQAKSFAVKCSKGYSCLSENPTKLCRVVFCVNCKILGVLCIEEDFCTFKHTMGDRTYCTCPVRFEIYQKYNL